MTWRRPARVLAVIGLAYLTLIVLVVMLEDRLLYHPTRGGQVSAVGRDVWPRTADSVALHARYTALDPRLPTLIYLHGTAGNLASRSDRLQLCTSLGANLLALDYRGYGRSGGTPSEAGLYLDARAAYDWAASHGDRRKIVLLGQSLGGGPACELAATRPVAGLILLSTFTSIPSIAARLLPCYRCAGCGARASTTWRAWSASPHQSCSSTAARTRWCRSTWHSSCSRERVHQSSIFGSNHASLMARHERCDDGTLSRLPRASSRATAQGNRPRRGLHVFRAALRARPAGSGTAVAHS